MLTCLSSPADEAATVAVLRSPLFGFSDEELFLHRSQGGTFRFLEGSEGKIKKAFQCLREWFQATRTLGVSDTLIEIYKRTNLLAVTAGQPHGEQRVANLMKVLDQARELETSQHFTYRAFTQWLTTQQEEGTMEGEAPGPDSSEDRITLMTIHKAKGLEFPIVFVSAWAADPKDSGSLVDRKHSAGAFKAGREDLGLWTTNYLSVQAEEELQRKAEDTRLLYVASTRARDSLLLPYFQFPAEGKFQNEKLFAGSLLKGLEEKGTPVRSVPKPPAEAQDLMVPASIQTPVHWAEMKEETKTLVEPPAWVVPLDGKFDLKSLEQEKEKWKTSQNIRKEKIKKLLGQKEFKSVSSVLKTDPEKQEKEESVFEDPEPASPWGGKDLGSLTHLLLEKGWDWDGAKLKKGATFYAEKMGIPRPQAEQAAQWAEKTLQSKLIQSARRSGKVFRELPITCQQEDGTYLNAVLDLAFLEGNEWVIVDYKTDQNQETRKDHYYQQLNHYADFLKKATGLKVKEASLFFVRENLAQPVPLNSKVV